MYTVGASAANSMQRYYVSVQCEQLRTCSVAETAFQAPNACPSGGISCCAATTAPQDTQRSPSLKPELKHPAAVPGIVITASWVQLCGMVSFSTLPQRMHRRCCSVAETVSHLPNACPSGVISCCATITVPQDTQRSPSLKPACKQVASVPGTVAVLTCRHSCGCASRKDANLKKMTAACARVVGCLGKTNPLPSPTKIPMLASTATASRAHVLICC